MALIPQIRGNVAYIGYRGLDPKVRNDAGIVGASDWKNRYIICAGAGSAGSSGSGDMIGHHIASAAKTRRAWSAKCRSSDRTEAVTIAGQWVKNRTALKNTRATSGRVKNRATALIGLSLSHALSIHTGVPAMSIGGATSENSMC